MRSLDFLRQRMVFLRRYVLILSDLRFRHLGGAAVE